MLNFIMKAPIVRYCLDHSEIGHVTLGNPDNVNLNKNHIEYKLFQVHNILNFRPFVSDQIAQQIVQ